MATILIVEDELLIGAEIERTLTRLGHSALDPVDSSDEALGVLATQPVELVLMDINIAGDCDGIAAALLIRRQFAVPVVFLTARSDSATLNRAKLAQPYGYLVKPFTDDSLRVQVELALYNAYQAGPTGLVSDMASDMAIGAGTQVLGPAERCPKFKDYLFVRKGSGHVKVLLSDILYFEALQNYVRLHTVGEKFVFDSTMKELEQKLPDQFFKTHRSYIVNLDHVQAYEESSVLLGQEYVPVSRSAKDEFKSRIHLVG
ncbi:LytR/AlgR family response regulator transcription factor [Hymenobacter actinosclerus]|uniref:Two component transcriptional regulator, LytTR family n=1 Tax=Hymenobacter actinosclerus TaxID=82805 RepID=A0A1I0IJQ9_9BACT|nr:LytTR family transcriptional regulator DNA-binding domain-containing protein [Hymenobacter actinosclerus]SET97278.1 two component transcriptional regulator, LytTR family [Hymenobacter actinosclerus]